VPNRCALRRVKSTRTKSTKPHRLIEQVGTAAMAVRCGGMKHPNTHLVAALAVVLSVGSAGAQTSGSGGTSSGTSTGTGGTTSPGMTRGAPAIGSTPTGPVTPNRSNSEIFAPSRLAPRPQGSIPDPGTSTGSPSAQSGANQNDTGRAEQNPQDPAALGSGRVPNPATGGIGSSTKTGKNPAAQTVADCMRRRHAYEQSRLGTHLPSCARQVGRSERRQRAKVI